MAWSAVTARMGIIPLGTTNVLARELGIPLDLDDACDLLAGPNRTADIDVMRVGDKHYVTQIGIGVDALMIRDTPDEHKRRLGVAAYLWTAVSRLIGFRLRRFSITADDRQVSAEMSPGHHGELRGPGDVGAAVGARCSRRRRADRRLHPAGPDASRLPERGRECLARVGTGRIATSST